MEYKTILGDTFDKIALKHYGDEKRAIDIIEANIEYADTIIFSSGVSLNIPKIKEVIAYSNLPPWKIGED